MYGIHDFALDGAQGGASFLERIQKSYGGASSVTEWATLAQFVNYEGYRAMYEAQSRNRMGLLIWMSHSAWPSLVWQTYDYFFEPTAGYFGARKGSEPLHIQWNPTTEHVEVVNYSGGNQARLTATARVFDIDGRLAWEKSATVDSKEDSTDVRHRDGVPAGRIAGALHPAPVDARRRSRSPRTSTGAGSRMATSSSCANCPRCRSRRRRPWPTPRRATA